MANEFHRLIPPPPGGQYVRAAWSGNIPQVNVLDWMNNDPAAPLTQAPADGPVVNPANPYLGSRFVAGKEDAADVFANRAHRALAENCDELDTAIRRAVAVPAMINWDPIAPTNTFSFPGAALVYGGGETPSVLRLLRRADLSEVMDPVGTAIQVLSATHDLLDAAGFGTNVVVTFTSAVPVGAYYIVFGAKNCVAELGVTDLLNIGIAGMVQIPDKIERLLLALHASVGSAWQQEWDAPWPSTVADLWHSGLDERYRRSSGSEDTARFLQVSGVDLGWPVDDPTLGNSPGGGAWILRDAQAVTAVSRRHLATPLATDKINACWRTVIADDANTHGGSVGVAVQGARPLFDDTHQFGPGLASSIIHRPARMNAIAWYGASGVTTIPDGGAAVLQYDAVSPGPISELTCELQDANAHFYKTSLGINSSAVTTGIDMLEVYDPADKSSKFWVIHRMISATKCVLRQLNGDVAPVGKANGGYAGSPVPTLVSVTWHTVISATSDGAAERQLQYAYAHDQYWPGYAPLPSPQNYGNLFLAALPWLGVISNKSLNQFQMFDQGVVGIFGSVIGNPIAGASPNPGESPLPHPDIALQIGSRQALSDAFGQTPLAPYFSVLSNGYTYAPKIFISAVGQYDPLPTNPAVNPDGTIRCEAGWWAPFMYTAWLCSPPDQGGVTNPGLTFFTDYGTLDSFMQFSWNLANVTISTPAGIETPSVKFEGGAYGLRAYGQLGYGYRDCLVPRHTGANEYVHVNVDNVAVECEVDLTENTYVMIDEWDLAGNNATLTIKFLGQPLYDKYSSIVGKIFTLNVYFSPNLPAGTRTLNITFGEADAIVHVYANTGTIVSGYDSTTHRYNSHYIDIYGGFRTALGGQRINLGVISKCSIQNLTQ